MLGGHSKSLLITRLRLMNHKLFLCSSNIPIPIKNSAFHFLNKQYQTSNWHPRSMVLRSVRCCTVSPGLSEKISECKVNVTSSSQSIYSNAVYWCKSRLILSRIIKYKHFFPPWSSYIVCNQAIKSSDLMNGRLCQIGQKRKNVESKKRWDWLRKFSAFNFVTLSDPILLWGSSVTLAIFVFSAKTTNKNAS